MLISDLVLLITSAGVRASL